jgi:TM2 domain-containing membrane protein YozV
VSVLETRPRDQDRADDGPVSPIGDVGAAMLFEANKKSIIVSYFLWLFMGPFGGHRFYNGRMATAIAQLSMCVVGFILILFFGIGFILLIPLGFWLLLDAFLIPGWVTTHNTWLAHQLSGR